MEPPPERGAGKTLIAGTLLLGPRIGQRLGEAGDREICRRGPGRKLSDVASPMFAAHERKVSGAQFG